MDQSAKPKNADWGIESPVYRQAMVNGRITDLTVDLYRPSENAVGGPLLVWFHSGAFHTGTTQRPGHRALGRHATKTGMTLAVPHYRLAAGEGDLSPSVRRQLPGLLRMCTPGFRSDMAGAAALAVLEDSVDLLHWLEGRRQDFAFSGDFVVGGSSAGGVNALNLVHTAPFLGLLTPSIGGVICYSGGFAYPEIYVPGRAPVLAAHNPNDRRVSVESIRALKEMDSRVTLIESGDQRHGNFKLFRKEGKGPSFRRIVTQARAMSGADDAIAETDR